MTSKREIVDGHRVTIVWENPRNGDNRVAFEKVFLSKAKALNAFQKEYVLEGDDRVNVRRDMRVVDVAHIGKKYSAIGRDYKDDELDDSK